MMSKLTTSYRPTSKQSLLYSACIWHPLKWPRNNETEWETVDAAISGPKPAEDVPEGPYPVVVTQSASGRRVPVVQAYAFGKYLGRIRLTFNEHGEVIEWSGSPLLLDKNVAQGKQCTHCELLSCAYDKSKSDLYTVTSVCTDRSKWKADDWDLTWGSRRRNVIVHEGILNYKQ